MKFSKKIDLVVISLIVGISTLILVIFDLKPLIGGIPAMIIPSVYLFLREPKNIQKILLGTIIFGGVLGFILDFLAEFNLAWNTARLVFQWKILGVEPIDNILGYMLMTLFILTFYEHFLDDEKNKKISKNLIRALVPLGIITTGIIVIFLVRPEFLQIPYAYLVMGSIAIVLPIGMSLYKTRFFTKFLKIGIYFFFVWFIAELAAVKTGAWIYVGGEYIGWVYLFGLAFPFEELLFWMMFYAVTTVSYYELFIDDLK